MSELKTKVHDGDPRAFIATVPDPERRADAEQLLELMESVTGEPAKMWGPSIVGFGTYHYTYASGREGDWFPIGFSPRKRELTLYLVRDFPEREALLARLGPHRTGKSCVYIKRLESVDLAVLTELISHTSPRKTEA